MDVRSNEAVELALNQTLPGLQIFVRDVNLPENLVHRYKVGLIIQERGYTDASARVGGMVTSCRYAILSNHMMDTDKVTDSGDKWRLHIANRGSRFKVLDVFQHDSKTLITLLHLPDNELWQVFQYAEIDNSGFDLVRTTRERFLAKYNIDPIPELAEPRWLDRCTFPLGMDDKGVFL